MRTHALKYMLKTMAAPFAYVTNSGSKTVSVIDRATNTVAATVPVGVSPVGVAITPNGASAYVANFGSRLAG
jgi:YVTN family beta-propeller protein